MTDADLPLFPVGAAVRRRLTLLYSDLSGSTALGADMEPEDYRALLELLRRIWHDAAQALQGRVVLTQGDGALLAFGLPMAGEQDGRHAVEAALQIHARVEALQPVGAPSARLPLRMHSGVHAGTLLLSDGDIERGVYDLSGKVFNATVALSRSAGPGEVVASQAALGPNAMFFEIGDGPVQDALSGRPGEVGRLCTVLARGQVANRYEATTRRGLTPFIGREALLARLQAFFAGGGQRCAVLQGGAGLGKTRLIAQMLGVAAPAGLVVLRGGCEHDLHAEVLQPFVQMLRGWLRQQAQSPVALPPALADSMDALAALAGQGGSPAVDRSGAIATAAERLRSFFTALAQDGPCLLVLDDWQWADDASRQLLQRLIADPGGPRLLLASRPREADAVWPFDATMLALDPFTPDETARVVHRLLQRPDPFLVARIHDYAGGVPLFIEELCHTVSAEQVLRALDGRSASQGWLATLVVARLQRLPPEQAAVVRAAAVVGNRVPLRWLAAVCGHAPAPHLLQALADADFLRREPDGTALRFKHGVTRDAVYESIGRSERMDLHRRLQDVLQDESAGDAAVESLEALAYHCRGAGSWQSAVGHAERAGDRAMAMFALDRARAHYLSASEALERIGPLEGETARHWCLLASKLGMTCIFDLLALPDALAIFRRAVQLADRWGDDSLRARAHYWLAYLLYGHGRLRLALAHCNTALALAEKDGDQRMAAQVRATLGQVLTALCRYDEALALMDVALQSKRGHARPGSSVAVGSAFTLACTGSVLGDRGDFRASQAAFAEARQLLGDTTHPVANSLLSWEVMVLLWQGRWADALVVAEESQALSRRSSALLPLSIASAAAGYALWMGRRDEAGFAQIEAAVGWMEQRNVQYYTSIYHGWLVEGLVQQHRAAAARRQALKLLARARAGEVLGLGSGRRALALAAAASGDLARALRQLDRADAEASRRRSAREHALNRQCRAQLLVAQQPAAARAMAQAAAAEFTRMQMDWHAAQSTCWLAGLG